MIELNKKTFGGIFFAIVVIIVAVMWGKLVETNSKGNYQIKQAALSGNMSARMTPGIYGQLFGDIDTWAKGQTYFFTVDQDTKDDVMDDTSIGVRFNDGSLCDISGTLRILMPTSESQAISLVTDLSYKSYRDVEEKLIKPTVRNVLRSTANLMSAKDSYSTRRPDFISFARDQIQNGLYETVEVEREVLDLVSGETIKKMFKEVKRVGGVPVYQTNPLQGTGIVLKNFEIKFFTYEEKVKTQISEQQNALMAVQTAKANAQRAEQDKLTIEAQGKARVAKAEYQELEVKVVAIVKADRDKEIAIINANKLKEQAAIAKEEAIIQAEKMRDVASLDSEAAEFEKVADIKRGEGEATRKKLVMEADGALSVKVNAWLKAQKFYAKEFGKQKWVPEVVMGGTGNETGNAAMTMIEMMGVKAAKDLALDMNMGKVVNK